ncbi:MAG: aminoacyl-tRNA hydrolase [Dehalococcoidia bacterium]
MKIIVGLGNPGDRYHHSRHNIGFRCIDLMARQWEIRLSERRAKAVLGRGNHLGQDVVLAKPRTFMNNSGEAVEYLLTRLAATPADLLVIYDEMDLPVGKLRLRPSGSTAGHNGMRSILQALRTPDFPRIRVGIGHPETKGDRIISHVLTRFSEEEAPIIADAVQRVAQAVDCMLEESIEVAMNNFN